MSKNFSNNVSKPTGNYESTINEKLSQYSIPTKREGKKKIEKFLLASSRSLLPVQTISKRKFALIIFDGDSIVVHMWRHTRFWITRRGKIRKKLSATVKNPFRFYPFDVFIFIGSGSIKRASFQCQRTKTKVGWKIYRLSAKKIRFNHNFRGKKLAFKCHGASSDGIRYSAYCFSWNSIVLALNAAERDLLTRTLWQRWRGNSWLKF